MIPGCGRKAANFEVAAIPHSHGRDGRPRTASASAAFRRLAAALCQRPSGSSILPVTGSSGLQGIRCGSRFGLLVSAFLLAFLALASISEATQLQSRKILILPFRVTSDQQELQSFGDHVEKKLRSALTPRDDALTLAAESVSRELLGGKGAPSSEQEAQALAAASDSDLVVYGFLSQEGSAYHMQGVMWDVRAGRRVVTTDLKVDNIHKLPGVLDLFVGSISTYLHGSPSLPFYRTEATPGGSGIPHSGRVGNLVSIPRNTGPWRSPDIPAPLSGLDMGDLDGDKKNETVFLEQGKLTISRFEDGILRQLTQFSHSPAQYISAQAADLDGDGVCELLLCYQSPAGLESSVARYVNRNFKVVARLPNVILRMIRDLDDPSKPMLVGQRTDDENVFSGEMTRFHMAGDEMIPAGNVRLPPGTLLLSYASDMLGKVPEFLQVILNQDQRLMVFDKENRLVAGITDKIYGMEQKIRMPFRQGYRAIAYPGKVVIADTDGDGENEVLVMKQAGDGSMIQALVWEDQRLVEKWKTVTSPGLITDFAIKDFKNHGVRSLVLILVKPGTFSFLTGSRSVVYAYDLLP